MRLAKSYDFVSGIRLYQTYSGLGDGVLCAVLSSHIVLVKLGASAKPFPQTSQLYETFRPVWVRAVPVLRVGLHRLNAFPQASQLYGFSPVWVRMCVLRLD